MTKTQNWLLKVHRKNGVIIPGPNGAELLPVYRNGDRRSRPIAWLKKIDFKTYLADGVLVECRGEYRVAHSVVRRLEHGNDGEHGAQHRVLEEREIYDPYGQKSKVGYNVNTNTFSRLCRLMDPDGKPFLSPDEIEAGNRFIADYGRSRMGRVQTQQFDNPRVDGQGADNAAEIISIAAIDAKRRVTRALKTLGPGLDRAVIAICGHNDGVGTVETRLGWARGSGKTVLKLALGRLSEFYGCKAGMRYKAPSAKA